MDDQEFVKCQFCGVDVAKHRLKRHIKRVHNVVAEARRMQRALDAETAHNRSNLLAKTVTCYACGEKVTLGAIKAHFGNVHQSPAPPQYLQMLGEGPLQNKFRGSRERENYWRTLESDNEESESADLFDRSKVLSGGAFGLGKNRKH